MICGYDKAEDAWVCAGNGPLRVIYAVGETIMEAVEEYQTAWEDQLLEEAELEGEYA